VFEISEFFLAYLIRHVNIVSNLVIDDICIVCCDFIFLSHMLASISVNLFAYVQQLWLL